MRTFGLLGFPLSHSFSQKYFSEKFIRENISTCEFKNFSIKDIEKFPSLLKSNATLCGLSITIPHKQTVMKYLDEINSIAKEVGAVNCIRINKNKKTKGFNTDIVGFEKSMRPILKPYHSRALVLGTGGAAKAVGFILDKLKIKFKYVSRKSGQISYAELNRSVLSKFLLIINTTPLGMFPNINKCPDIPYEFITSKHLLYDLTYNPEESLFLKKGKEKGAQTKNGLEMLQLQADEAWRIWNEAPST